VSERDRWGVVVAYAALAAATQVLWLTFAPITTDAAAHYGVGESAIGWLAEVFPLLYVVLALPAGMALDRAIGVRELRSVWDDRSVRTLCALAFVGFGVFIALTTWLQALLKPFGVAEGTAGAMLAAMVLAGVANTTWLPAAAARRRAERAALAGALVVCCGACALLAGVRAVAAAAGLPFARRLAVPAVLAEAGA
jgi:cyanate permease